MIEVRLAGPPGAVALVACLAHVVETTALVKDVVTRASAATGCRAENFIVSATHHLTFQVIGSGLR